MAPIRPVIPIITVALRATSDGRKLDIFLPAMNEERTIPMISVPIPLLSASFLFPMVLFLSAPIPVLALLPGLPRSSVSNYNTRSGRPP